MEQLGGGVLEWSGVEQLGVVVEWSGVEQLGGVFVEWSGVEQLGGGVLEWSGVEQLGVVVERKLPNSFCSRSLELVTNLVLISRSATVPFSSNFPISILHSWIFLSVQNKN